MSDSAATGAMPAHCPHCEKPADFSVHHGLSFCNSCGKKVSPKTLGSPASVSTVSRNAPAATPSTPSALVAPIPVSPVNNARFTTPPRVLSTDRAAGDDDDDVVTFKHSMQSPPPPSRLVSGDDPTPLPPTRTVKNFPTPSPTNRAATAAASAATPASAITFAALSPKHSTSAAAASKSSSNSNPPSSSTTPAPTSSATITLTEEEFSSLEATIREEMKTAHAAETEILNMELNDVSRELEKSHAEKLELQRTMDEMMVSFNQVVEDANARKNDFTAQSGILETEMNQLRSQYTAQKSALQTIKDAHVKLQTDHEEQTLRMEETQSLYDKLRGEHDILRASYDKLRTQAQEKLSEAGNEYRAVLQKGAEKDALLQAVQSELKATKRALADAEHVRDTASARLEISDRVAQDKTAEASDLTAQVASLTGQLQSVQARYTESAAIAARYKDQIVETRTQIRDLEDAARERSKFEKDAATVRGENVALSKENQQLKSQLFDSFQVEKALKAQLEGKGVASTSVEDKSKLVRMETENANLQATLQVKETELAELTAICTDLISQVELLKAQQTS